MTPAEVKAVVVDALTRIAPEVEPGRVAGNVDLREDLDLDSMDFLNFVMALHDRFGIEIPETDYPKLSTLDAAVAYVCGRVHA